MSAAIVVGLLGASAPALGGERPKSVTVVAILDENESAGFTNDTARAGLQAGIEALNARGGLEGTRVKLEICTTTFNVDEAATCARRAVADEDVVAFTSNVINEGDVVNPILEQAGIASLAPYPVSLSDYSSLVSFPISPGTVSAGGAALLLADELDASTIVPGLLDVSGAAQAVTLVEVVLGDRDVTLAEPVILPIAKQDLAAEATKADDEGEAVELIADPTVFARFVQAFRQQSLDADLATFGAVTTAPALESLGSEADGIYVALGLQPDTAKVRGNTRYRRELKKYGDGSASDEQAKNAWLSVQLLEAVASNAASLDRAGILAAVQSLTEFDTGGITPPIDFTVQSTAFGGALPHLYNDTVVFARIKNGKFALLNKEFVPVFGE